MNRFYIVSLVNWWCCSCTHYAVRTQWSWVHSMFTRDVHDVIDSLPCRRSRSTVAGRLKSFFVHSVQNHQVFLRHRNNDNHVKIEERWVQLADWSVSNFQLKLTCSSRVYVSVSELLASAEQTYYYSDVICWRHRFVVKRKRCCWIKHVFLIVFVIFRLFCWRMLS